MAKAGTDYQEQAAIFFRSLTLSAEVEADIEGARGKHEIDVWVTGKLHTFDVRWVVECKDWKSNVPKEKVLALQAITQDVGADRGFLLSETGFQAGAVRCAHNTNITLASLEDLREQTKAYMIEATLAAVHLKLEKVIHDLHAATTWTVNRTKTRDGSASVFGSVPGGVELTGRLSILQHTVFRALHEGFPIVYDFTKDERPVLATSPEELIAIATHKIGEAEEFIDNNRHRRPANALE
jgi:hypothetical protein